MLYYKRPIIISDLSEHFYSLKSVSISKSVTIHWCVNFSVYLIELVTLDASAK